MANEQTDPDAEALIARWGETVARTIARAMGDNFSDAFKNKARWIAKRGMSGGRFRDVNEPYQGDYLDAAAAAIRALLPAIEGEWFPIETAPVDPLVEEIKGLADKHGVDLTQEQVESIAAYYRPAEVRKIGEGAA